MPVEGSNVVCCAGTTLYSLNNSRLNEVVWNGKTGGGISKYFDKPSYQNNVIFDLKGKRGVGDISGLADPNTGIQIYYRGKFITVGGTSVTAPLMTSLFARINKLKNLPFINPILYQNITCFYDIISGNNNSYYSSLNWDCCSGLGVPDGIKILNLFSTSTPPPTPINIPTPTFDFTYRFYSNYLIIFNIISTVKITNCLWNFGDGILSKEFNTTHLYKQKGIYNVTLTINKLSLTKQLTI